MNTMISAARLYAENTFSFFGVKGVSEKLSVAVSVFPDELYQAAESWDGEGVSQPDPLQQARQLRLFPGGEVVALFCEEVRAGFRSLR
jgi:hypothetical protein